jgi:cardiolipin synthase
VTTGLVGGNRVELLDSGVAYFPRLIEALDAARSEVFLETYIYADDATAARITEALATAAARGVRVHLVVDGFGARDMPARFRDELARAGALVLTYRPPLWWQPVRGLRRMHRKLAAIDGQIGFVGGINVIDDWNTPNEVPPRYDYAVRVEGPLVAEITRAARALWAVVALATLRRRALPAPPPAPGVAGQVRAALLTRDNLAHRRDIEVAYLDAIRAARSDVLLSIAYFLPSTGMLAALGDAARRGVRVRVMLQGPSDHPLIKRASEALYRRALAAGVTLIEYRKSFLHTKVGVIDDAWATVGSSNLDPFSLLLSREANVVVADAGFAATLRASLEAAITAGGREVMLDDVVHAPWHVRLRQWAAYRFTRLVIDWLNLARKN